MKKRLFAMFLALTMALSLVPTMAMAAENVKGSEDNPYSCEEFAAMTREQYIAAQEELDGTMYVEIGDYKYNNTKGVLGNDSKLNYYGAPGAKSDDAAGKSIVFVGGTITSDVTGYESIDDVDTSLLLAVPAYTDVTFKRTTFNNVMRFSYQLYTSPWSQLGELKFEACTFNGIVVGATAAQTLTFDRCEFTDYTNATKPNNSNPTWIRPAYGNWNAGDNKGQGDDFRSLTEINFTNNKVTSTRPVKFEFISQWDITSTVTATNNYFDISAQDGDEGTKNVGLYLGTHKDDNGNKKFNLIVEKNRKSDNTAALYTIPEGEESLPAGSTVKDSEGNEVTITDALEWKTDKKVELKTEYEASAVAGINGVGYDTLDDAINAAGNGDTITILKEGPYEGTLLGGLSNKKATIKAADKVNVKFDMPKTDYQVVTLSDAKVTFEGIEFNYGTAKYVGLAHTDRVVYNNCTINGQVFLYGASETFNDCTFNQTSANAYNVWTYGAKEVDFNGCTFKCEGKSVLVYNEGTISGTDLTVTNTTFHASQPVKGKAAIEIDTSYMNGQTKITVDQATESNTTGFGTGSNSGSSLWNDKMQTADTNKNTTVVVAGKTVFEPTCVDLDTFIKMVEDSNYNFDGTRGNGSKLTVKWSPVSGCFDPKGSYHQLGDGCPKKQATGNTPNRLQDPYAQYQLFANAKDLSINNVCFVYTPAEVSVCGNMSWGGKKTPTLAELQLLNSGNTTFTGCTFDKVTVSPYGKGNAQGNTNEQNTASFTDCEFSNIADKYAIKDVYAGNVTVENCTFTDCGGGIYLEGNATKGAIDISGNEFVNIGSKGLIQFSASGDYTQADITLDGNTATNCGPILRQLNQGIVDNNVLKNNLKGDLTGLGGKLTYTGDSKDTLAQPTVYTVKFENAEVAAMKVIQGTEITLPAPSHRPNYTFEGWYVGNTKVSSPYTVSDDVTLVAQWRYIDQGGGSDSSSSSDGDYIVSVDTGKHGTVTVSPKRADKGDTVTITVKPDKGYELDELTVTDKNGDTVKLKDKGNGKFSFTMPGSKVTVEAKFVKESASQLPFADVSADYWAYDEIAWAYENGYMNGTSAAAFNPGGNVSRQQLWMILARLSGASPASMAEAREWAIGNGISDGSNPGGAISRQQMVATLYRYAKLMGYDTTGTADLTAFPDHASVADYAKEAMAWSVKNEIVGGTAQGTLNPAGTASRAQFAVILYRFVK